MDSVALTLKLARKRKDSEGDVKVRENRFHFETHTAWGSLEVLKKNGSLGGICTKVVNVGIINL